MGNVNAVMERGKEWRRDGGGWSPVVTRNPIVMHRTREGLGGGEREKKLGPLNLNFICVHNRFSSTLPHGGIK